MNHSSDYGYSISGQLPVSEAPVRFFLQIEFDDEPAYIFEGDAALETEAIVTIAPGHRDLAEAVLAFLNGATLLDKSKWTGADSETPEPEALENERLGVEYNPSRSMPDQFAWRAPDGTYYPTRAEAIEAAKR